MAVKFGGHKTDYSAMQGPCPSGFHIPTNDEWGAVKTVWTTLGGGSSDGTNFGTALKLPFAGYRSYSSSNTSSQGTYGRYWCCSYGVANSLNFSSSAINPQGSDRRSYGYSVRSFKDAPVVPTSSWTKLYGTSIEAGGIFWSSSDGIISLSSDGQTWITMQDKNLGATTVWNSGDTLSEANCGKYYQRGNNYGFPRTGTVTTSSTQVDASTYGPGNYYSSSTFIKRSSSPYDWSSVQNDNLRGGVTGLKPGDLQAAYIGEYVIPHFTPTVHTLCYLPLTAKTTTTDYGTLGWTWTKAGSNGGTFIDNYYRSGGNGDYGRLQTGTNTYVNYPTFTFSVWLKMSSNLNDFIHISNYGNGDNGNLSLYYNQARLYTGSTYSYSISPNLNTGTRTLLTITYSQSNKGNLYVDGTLRGTRGPTNFNLKPYIAFVNGARLGGGGFGGDMCYSDYILEDQEWSAQNVADYYNLVKSNYGIS